eukprot:2100625-Rhodomonas_salina.1
MRAPESSLTAYCTQRDPRVFHSASTRALTLNMVCSWRSRSWRRARPSSSVSARTASGTRRQPETQYKKPPFPYNLY